MNIMYSTVCMNVMDVCLASFVEFRRSLRSRANDFCSRGDSYFPPPLQACVRFPPPPFSEGTKNRFFCFAPQTPFSCMTFPRRGKSGEAIK